jgi:hypothetical protein
MDVLSEIQADAMAQSEVERAGNKVAKVTRPWYDNHHFKPMPPGIMLDPKPLAKHDEQCFEQPQLLQHWHKAVLYLLEACLHFVDDTKCLKDVFDTIIENPTSLKSHDHGVTPDFFMGMDRCTMYV